MNLIAYCRVSTDEQDLGLDAQRDAIAAYCKARLWTLEDIATDQGVSGSTPWHQRPALARAIKNITDGAAEGLIAAKLDRLGRSAFDVLGLFAQAKEDGWHIVVLDLGIDTTTPVGQLLVTILAGVAEFELNMIRSRTREALAALKRSGVKLGRPGAPPHIRERILLDRESGMTLQAIADALNLEGVPTAYGAPLWRHSTIAHIVKGQLGTAPRGKG